MSRIYFHSPSGEAEVSGSERAYAGMLCANLLIVALGIVGDFVEPEMYRRLLPLDAYPLRAKSDAEFFMALRAWMSVAWENRFFTLPSGEQVSPFHAALNTAIAGGSDAVRLLARLHAQCEIHCYVEGKNRAWLAGIIEQGVEDNVLRTGKKFEGATGGWHAVIDLLKARDDEPVVTSYSVTEPFPNRHIAEPDYTDEAWYALPKAEQWVAALKGLRKRESLEIDPETLAQRYGEGLSGFDIYAAMLASEVNNPLELR